MAVSRNPCRYCAKAHYDVVRNRMHQSFAEECFDCKWLREHDQYLQSKRKFKAGERIKDFPSLIEQEWVIFSGKTKHIEAIKSMTLRTVLNFIKMGLFYYAINNNEGDKDNDGINESGTSNAGAGAGTENTSETND